MGRIMEKMTEEVIVWIVVIVIVILAGFYFIGGGGPGPYPDPDSSPDAIYECSILSKELEEFIDGCGLESQEISLIDTSKQKIATLNLIDLIKSCPGGCTQVPIRLDADYVTTVSSEGKGYFIIFTKVLADEEINKAIETIASKHSPQINDKFYFSVVGSDKEALALSYQFIPMQATIINNEKNRHKLVQLSLAENNLSDEPSIEVGFNSQKFDTFISEAELKEKLNNYFGSLETAGTSIGYNDLREASKESIMAKKEDLSNLLIFSGDNVDSPVVYASSAVSYVADEVSCNRWHSIAYRHNVAVNQCKKSGKKSCGYYYNADYTNYFLKVKGRYIGEYLSDPIGDVEVNVYPLYKKVWKSSSCDNELETINNVLF